MSHHVVHPGCMWRSTCLGDTAPWSIHVDDFLSCWGHFAEARRLAMNPQMTWSDRWLMQVRVLKWIGDGTHFLSHSSHNRSFIRVVNGNNKIYTTMDWLGIIALKDVIHQSTVMSFYKLLTAPRASRPGAIQSQGRSTWAFKTPNACRSKKKFLNTDPDWCFIWDPGSIFAGVWSQVLEGLLNNGDNWGFINSFWTGDDDRFQVNSVEYWIGRNWSKQHENQLQWGKHPWAQTSPKLHW